MSTAPHLDHGAIGNGRVIALISPDSGVEWLCLPRFDSPSLFAALLDRERGGVFRFLVAGEPMRGPQAYLANTNVLRTELVTPTGVLEIIDFAPRVTQGGGRASTPQEIVRIVRPISGAPRMTVDFSPAPDYGRVARRLIVTTHGVEVLDAGAPLHLYSNVAGDHICSRAEISVRHPLYFVLSYGNRTTVPTMSEVDYLLSETILGWRMWAKTCALPASRRGSCCARRCA